MEELAVEYNTTVLKHQSWSWQSKPREEAERCICSSLTKKSLYLAVINNNLMTNYKEDIVQYKNALNIVMNLVWTLEILFQKKKKILSVGTLWNKLPRDTVECLSLQRFRIQLDTAQSNLLILDMLWVRHWAKNFQKSLKKSIILCDFFYSDQNVWRHITRQRQDRQKECEINWLVWGGGKGGNMTMKKMRFSSDFNRMKSD